MGEAVLDAALAKAAANIESESVKKGALMNLCVPWANTAPERRGGVSAEDANALLGLYRFAVSIARDYVVQFKYDQASRWFYFGHAFEHGVSEEFLSRGDREARSLLRYSLIDHLSGLAKAERIAAASGSVVKYTEDHGYPLLYDFYAKDGTFLGARCEIDFQGVGYDDSLKYIRMKMRSREIGISPAS